MNVVGRADVDCSQLRISNKIVERCVRALDSEFAGRFLSAFGRAAQDPTHRNSEAAQRFEMRFANKTYSDDCRRFPRVHYPTSTCCGVVTTAARAWSRSVIRSSTFSIPTESRMS